MLHSVYHYERPQLARALIAFAAARVTLENPVLAAKALGWMGGGMDFADALHLAAATGCEAFITFDQRFAAVAAALSQIPVRAL